MFYTFYQNNSGGFLDGPEYIIIEADSAEKANDIAESETPVYFDGCAHDIDCKCCGDRWYRAWVDDGTETPMVYGNELDWDRGNPNARIYYKDSTITEATYS
jgi:hypothetical protein